MLTCTGASVVAGGSGYRVGDLLTVIGASTWLQVAAIFGVGVGPVASVTCVAGGRYLNAITGTLSTSGGSGSGATVRLGFVRLIGACNCACCSGCLCQCNTGLFGTDGKGYPPGGVPSGFQSFLSPVLNAALNGKPITIRGKMDGATWTQRTAGGINTILDTYPWLIGDTHVTLSWPFGLPGPNFLPLSAYFPFPTPRIITVPPGGVAFFYDPSQNPSPSPGFYEIFPPVLLNTVAFTCGLSGLQMTGLIETAFSAGVPPSGNPSWLMSGLFSLAFNVSLVPLSCSPLMLAGTQGDWAITLG